MTLTEPAYIYRLSMDKNQRSSLQFKIGDFGSILTTIGRNGKITNMQFDSTTPHVDRSKILYFSSQEVNLEDSKKYE